MWDNMHIFLIFLDISFISAIPRTTRCLRFRQNVCKLSKANSVQHPLIPHLRTQLEVNFFSALPLLFLCMTSIWPSEYGFYR